MSLILHIYAYLLPIFIRYGFLRDVIQRYVVDGDAERAYGDLVNGNWAKTFLMGKTKKQISAFKAHVNLSVHLWFVT